MHVWIPNADGARQYRIVLQELGLVRSAKGCCLGPFKLVFYEIEHAISQCGVTDEICIQSRDKQIRFGQADLHIANHVFEQRKSIQHRAQESLVAETLYC